MTKKIQKKLDLVPFDEPKRSVVDETKDDYNLAKDNLKELLGQINTAIKDLADVSKTSQHPRAYEVLDKLFKTSAETSKDLLDITRKKQEIIKAEEEEKGPKKLENHQHLHITTAELNKMLEGKMKDNE